MVSVSSTVGTCTKTATALSCNLGVLAVGASVTITVQVQVAASVAGNVTNTATVASTTPDPTPGNNTSTTIDPAAPVADVSVVKSAPVTVVGGSTFTYSLQVSNAGPSTATGVSLVDALPAGTTFVSATTSCAAAGGTVTCTIGTVSPGQSLTVEITVQAPNGAKVVDLKNTGVVSATTPDPVPGNNTSTVVTTVTPADGTLTGTVWNDTDGDGVRDSGEVGIPGVSVTIIGDPDGDGTPTVITVVTDASGGFSVTLPPGSWSVTVVQSTVPVGLSATTATTTTIMVPPKGSASVSFGFNVATIKPPLPSTGSDVVRGLRDAGCVLVLGVAVVLVARRRRRRQGAKS